EAAARSECDVDIPHQGYGHAGAASPRFTGSPVGLRMGVPVLPVRRTVGRAMWPECCGRLITHRDNGGDTPRVACASRATESLRGLIRHRRTRSWSRVRSSLRLEPCLVLSPGRWEQLLRRSGVSLQSNTCSILSEAREVASDVGR